MAAAAEEAEEAAAAAAATALKIPCPIPPSSSEEEERGLRAMRGPVKDAVIKDLLSCMLARVCVCRSGPMGDKKKGAS